MKQATYPERSLVMDNPKLLVRHNEKVIQFFSKNVKATAVPMLTVIGVITLVLYLEVGSALIWLWLAQALLVQIPRILLASRISDSTNGSLEDRMKLAILLAAIGGISISSVVLFAPQMTIETRTLMSIILVGLIVASVTNCHGFKPIYLAFVAPLFASIIILWLVDGIGDVRLSYRVIMLFITFQLGLLFLGIATRVHASFCEVLVSAERAEVALHTEKMANSAKTRFLAAASHDLRQPLHTMSLFSAALAVRPLDEKSKSIANKMNEAMKDLADELDSLLDISKLDAGIVPVERASLDLSSLVSRVSSLFKPRTDQKNIELNIEIQEQLFVHSDGKLIERLLRNILDNAVKYTQKGAVTCNLYKENGFAVISIADTGPGINGVDQEQIWEEFYQVDNESRNRQQGLGLGLSVVSRLAKLLDIRVNLVPQVGNGSRFEIVIPAFYQDSAAARAQPLLSKTDNSDNLKGRHVLVVDDDEGIQQGTESLLTAMGMKVSVASDTRGAVEKYSNESIDVVLMDLRLADGDDGFDAIKKLQAVDDQVDVIVMSGDTAPDRLKTAESIGCAWLIKPVKLELLVAEFNRILV